MIYRGLRGLRPRGLVGLFVVAGRVRRRWWFSGGVGQSGCGRGLRGLRPRGLPSAAARGPVGSAGCPITSLFWVLFAFVGDGCEVCRSRVHRLGALCFLEGVRFQSISALALNVPWTLVTSRSIVVGSSGDSDFLCVVLWMCLLRCCLRPRCLMVDV